jgi:predicted ester cyclase
MKKFWLLIVLTPLFLFGKDSEVSHIMIPKGEANPLTDNKIMIQNFYEAFEKNAPASLDETLASRYSVQDSTVAFDSSSYSKYDPFSKNMKIRLHALHEAFPDLTVKVLETLAEGNKVCARVQFSGIQRGPFLGIEKTNKPVVIKIFAIFTIEDGKISHINEIWNEFGVMKQMGYLVL